MNKRMQAYYSKYYRGLIGGTIIAAGVNGAGFPYFRIDKDGKESTIEVSQDPEGNGPGFLFGLEAPAP